MEKEKVILTVGKKTNAEIAKWMNISSTAFYKNKEKKLKLLENFAIFHFEGKNIIIDEVLDEVFKKKSNYQKVFEKIDENWSKNGLDTCVNVGKKILTQLKKEDSNFSLKESTVIRYTNRGKVELFGKCYSEGLKGKCVYITCKYENGNYEFFTEEENKIRAKLLKKYFGNISEKQLYIKEMIDNGEITEEKAWVELERITNMTSERVSCYYIELSQILNCDIVKATFVLRNGFNYSKEELEQFKKWN